MSMSHGQPRALEPLTEDECWRLLRRGDLGRLAWAAGEELLVVPVNYTLQGEDIVVRTDPAGLIAQTAVGGRAAFQVEDVHRDGPVGWTVVAQVRVREDDDPDAHRVQHLMVQPWAPGDRSCLLRLGVTGLSGRRLRHVVR